jgi:hypothetical protein
LRAFSRHHINIVNPIFYYYTFAGTKMLPIILFAERFKILKEQLKISTRKELDLSLIVD